MEANTYKIQVGDILEYEYNYNSCHPHFVRVERVSDSCVWTRNMPNTVVDADAYGQNGSVMPSTNINGQEKPARHVKKTGRDGNEYIKVDGHMATLWDGLPKDFYTD